MSNKWNPRCYAALISIRLHPYEPLTLTNIHLHDTPGLLRRGSLESCCIESCVCPVTVAERWVAMQKTEAVGRATQHDNNIPTMC